LVAAPESAPALGATAIGDKQRFPGNDNILTRRALDAWRISAGAGDASSALNLGNELLRLRKVAASRIAFSRAVELGSGVAALRLASLVEPVLAGAVGYAHASHARRLFRDQRDTVHELRAICIMADLVPTAGGTILVEFLESMTAELHEGGLHEAIAAELRAHGRLEDAVAAYERALADEWHDDRAFEYATALIELGRLDDAQEVAEELWRVSSDNGLLIDLAARFAALGHGLDARAILGGDERLAARDVAWRLYKDGYFGAAEAQLRWAATCGHVPAQVDLALLLALTGRPAEADRACASSPRMASPNS
jgi:tetratricopeptide (TPR) repeat protein